MFQDVGEHCDVKECGGLEVTDVARVNNKARLPCHCCRCLVQLKAFHPETVSSVNLQTPPLIAANVKQAPRPRAAMKGDIAIQTDPKPVKERGEEPLTKICVESPSLTAEIIVRFIETL
jgi:hypothetical protein